MVALRRAGDVPLEGMFAHVDGHLPTRGVAGVKKRGQPAAVVVVPVAEHRQVSRGHVHAERPRVGEKRLVRPHVKQDAPAIGELEPQAEPVPRRKAT